MRLGSGPRFLWIVFVLLSAALLAAACGAGGAEGEPGGGSEEGVVEVIVNQEGKFEPFSVTIKAGTTVRWVNMDDEPHSATHGPADVTFDSGVLQPGETFEHTFRDAPLNYDYIDTLNPLTIGRLIVIE